MKRRSRSDLQPTMRSRDMTDGIKKLSGGMLRIPELAPGMCISRVQTEREAGQRKGEKEKERERETRQGLVSRRGTWQY